MARLGFFYRCPGRTLPRPNNQPCHWRLPDSRVILATSLRFTVFVIRENLLKLYIRTISKPEIDFTIKSRAQFYSISITITAICSNLSFISASFITASASIVLISKDILQPPSTKVDALEKIALNVTDFNSLLFSQGDILRKYGSCRSNICFIINKKTWIE